MTKEQFINEIIKRQNEKAKEKLKKERELFESTKCERCNKCPITGNAFCDTHGICFE